MTHPLHSVSGLPDPRLDAQFYAGVPFKRLLAWGIDLVVLIVLYIASIVLTLGISILLAIPFLFLLNFGYRAVMIYHKSATLGMLFAGIELRDRKGNRFNGEHALFHTGLYAVLSILFPLQVISMGMMLVSHRGQGLHDYLLGTTAINRPVD